MNKIYDIVIIGAGITGSAIAYELSKYNLNIAVIEKNNDVAMATTRANSGIVHAGYDPLPNTTMARLNVLGNKLIQELAPKFNVHYKKVGSLVIGKKSKDQALIDELYKRGVDNGVEDLKILNRKDIVALEPHINEDIDYALYAPSAGIISPWELALALACNAKINDVDFFFDTKVLSIKKNSLFSIVTSKGAFDAKYVINAAGLYADEIYDLVADDAKDKFKITPMKGEYYLLDKSQAYLANTVIFQTPNELGKGVLVSPTVHGNLIVGPNAAFNEGGKDDVSTTSAALAYIRNASSLSVKDINFRDNIRNFTGNRATIKGLDDFIIGESEVKGFINFAGIKSPGISCGPAFGVEAVSILEKMGLTLIKKEKHKIYRLPSHFKDLTAQEINELISKNNLYGRIICRCETVSEQEIVNALEMPIPACSIDGVKRRTNAGMGRCQGGFCGPKIFEIIERVTATNPIDILQDGVGSNIVKDFTKGGDDNE